MPFLEAISRLLLSALPLAELLFAMELYDDGNVKLRCHIVLRPVPLLLWSGGLFKQEYWCTGAVRLSFGSPAASSGSREGGRAGLKCCPRIIRALKVGR